MDHYQFALQMEKDGEQFYRDLANNAVYDGFKTIFTQLADDEVEHQKIFTRLQANLPVAKAASHLAGPNVFAQLKKDDFAAGVDDSQLNLYQKALEMEKQSQDLYAKEAAATTEPELATIFKQLAAEEERHYFLIHNIVELMLHPQNWVENGEFYHLEEY